MKDVKEEKQNVLQLFVGAIKDLWTNPTARYVTIGGAFRFFEAFGIVDTKYVAGRMVKVYKRTRKNG